MLFFHPIQSENNTAMPEEKYDGNIITISSKKNIITDILPCLFYFNWMFSSGAVHNLS